MRPIDLELLVRRHIHDIRAGRGAEDDRIELKRDWPNPNDVRRARQLAGAANALRGEPLIYVIGCAEDGAIHPLSSQEPESWYSEISSLFDSDAPHLSLHRNVVLGDDPGDSAIVLLFETDGFPYVMQVEGKSDRREVPIRVLTGTRSANRHQLLGILAPTVRTPPCEIVEASVSTRFYQISESKDYKGNVSPAATVLSHNLRCKFLVAHVGETPTSLILGKARARIRFPALTIEHDGRARFHSSSTDVPQPAHGISVHQGIAAVTGPGILDTYFRVEERVLADSNWDLTLRAQELRGCRLAVAELKLYFVGSDSPVRLSAQLPRIIDRGIGGSEVWGQSWNIAAATDQW